MPSAPASSLQTSLCALGHAMAAIMDMALYNLVLLRARPRHHPRRKPQVLFHPAHDMRRFPAALLLSAQVVETPSTPCFIKLAAGGLHGDLLLHPHETLAHIGEAMDRINAAVLAGDRHDRLAGDLVDLAARALWMKNFLVNARHCLPISATEPTTPASADAASLMPRRSPAPCSWQTDARRMDRLTKGNWQACLANLPDPWSEKPRISLLPLAAGRQHHGVWMTADMAATLAAMASRCETTAGSTAWR